MSGSSAPAGAGDHDVARTQILEIMVGDRPHAFGHGLVLAMNAGNAGVALALLRLPVDHPVVRRVLGEPPAASPWCSADSRSLSASPAPSGRSRSDRAYGVCVQNGNR